ncbi:MAG: fluoride efflux transporter FluC [Acidimicrobiales bacterium]
MGVLTAIAGGGALGGIARHGVSLAFPTRPSGIPWSTVVVNLGGSLLVGAVMTLIIERWPPTRYARPFAAVGFCGGFTTFSTLDTDAVLLSRDGRAVVAAVYVVATTIAGLAATYAGVGIGRLWPTERRHR